MYPAQKLANSSKRPRCVRLAMRMRSAAVVDDSLSPKRDWQRRPPAAGQQYAAAVRAVGRSCRAVLAVREPFNFSAARGGEAGARQVLRARRKTMRALVADAHTQRRRDESVAPSRTGACLVAAPDDATAAAPRAHPTSPPVVV